MKKSDSKAFLAVILTALVVGGGAAAGTYYFQMTEIDSLRSEKAELVKEKDELITKADELDNKVSTEFNKEEEMVDDEFEDKKKIDLGYITGTLSYPSEVLPIDMKVCAEDVETKQEYCTSDRFEDKKSEGDYTYKIEVPEGRYLVYANLPENSKDGHDDLKGKYRAYYSEFVTCGAKAGCPSHEPIEVEVNTGEVRGSVDPGDWYDTK